MTRKRQPNTHPNPTGDRSEALRLPGKQSSLTKDELKTMAMTMWHDHGIALLAPEDMPMVPLRGIVHFEPQVVITIANRIYGKRRDET